MNKTCIWCLKTQEQTPFLREAHIFPKSLGGSRVCSNVCDACNTFFGSKQAGLPSVEIALKEPLNISRFFLLSQNKKYALPRFKSEYFNYNLQSRVITPKNKYRLIYDFQTTFTKQFKKGIYKIFLEERSQTVGDALSSQFNFIREFARWGIGDYPVFYCQPAIPVIPVSETDLKNPVIRFTEHSDQVMKQFGFYSYYFITHTLAIPVIRTYEITLHNYIKFLLQGNQPMYSRVVPLKYITDLDFLFSYALDNKQGN